MLFHNSDCDTIMTVGGGSAFGFAKCIKLYNANSNMNYLKQPIVPNDIKLFAVPTTAGTGSEATRYAITYCEEEKQHQSMRRNYLSGVFLLLLR